MNTIPTPYSQASFHPTKTYTPNEIGALGVELFILRAGTGGIMTAHSAAELLNRLHYPPIHVEHSRQSRLIRNLP